MIMNDAKAMKNFNDQFPKTYFRMVLRKYL